MARYNLYLDDERDPKTSREFIVVRSFKDACDVVVTYGFPEYVSFDHDLGDDVPSGFDFAKWLVEHDMDTGEMPDNFSYNVHSANPCGRDNIIGLLDNYLEHKRGYNKES